MIIDSHAHIYPDKLARKAARSIGDFYDIDMDLDGTVDHASQSRRRGGS